MKYVSILTPSSDVIYLCSLLESRKSFVEIELNERLRRRRQELKIKLEMLNETNGIRLRVTTSAHARES